MKSYKGDWIIVLVFGMGIVLGPSIHFGLKYNWQAGLISFAIFGIIVSFLLFVFFYTR